MGLARQRAAIAVFTWALEAPDTTRQDMRTFTDEELEELIACAKRVKNPPRREMRLEGKMKRNDMTLRSADGKHNFDAFMRQSEEFQENFSIGLTYHPGDEPGSFPLIRFNGQHGGERVHPHHAYFHIHRSKADDINAGILEARQIEETAAYASFREALAYFCTMIKLESADNFFPGISQTRLFPEDEVQP